MPSVNQNTPLSTSRYRKQSGVVTFNGYETNRSNMVLVRTSVNTPNFNAKGKRPGTVDLPFNNFYYKREINRGLQGKYTYYNYAHPEYGYLYDYSYGTIGTSIGRFYAQPTTAGWFTASEMEAVNQKAISNLLSRIKDQKVNLVQMFAERAQTAELFAQTAKRIASCMHALRSGDFLRAARDLGLPGLSQRTLKRMNKRRRNGTADGLANNWLELQYGWQPLLQDCYGSAELIAQKQVREIFARTNAKSTLKRDRQWYDPAILQPTQKIFRSDNVQFTVKYGVVYGTTDDGIKTMSQIGLLNPATIAWELMPWSFVVDWFIPFGNYVNSWDSTVGLQFKKGFKTTFLKGKHYYRLTENWVHAGTPWEVEVGDADGNYEKIECSRTSLGSFPRLSFPSFKNPVSATHLANSIALLKTSFSR